MTWQQVETEFQCDHINTEVRYKTDRLGRILYKRQCLDCGQAVGEFISHAKVENKDSVSPWDDAAEQDYYEGKRERRQELYDLQNEDWWETYSDYLERPEWQAKRAAVLERDDYICQACLSRPATQVHHLPGSYKYIPNEPLFMLISICNQCHDFITAIDNGGSPQDDRRNVTSSTNLFR